MATDSKLADAQAGAENARSAMLGALTGINMISGAGMLGSLDCHSAEKLVIDAESIASGLRLVRGIEAGSDALATDLFAQVGLSGEFLKLKETRALFRKEQHIPSAVIDRSGRGGEAASDAFARARVRVNELVDGYRAPTVTGEVLREFEEVVERASAVHWVGGR